MTPETLDIERLIDIICDAFDGEEEDSLYTPEGIIARSAFILLHTLSSGTSQKVLNIVLRQVGESIEYLAACGMATSEELSEALELVSGSSAGSLSDVDEGRFQDIINNLQ